MTSIQEGRTVREGDYVKFVSGIDRHPPVGTHGLVTRIEAGRSNPIVVRWVVGGTGYYDALDVAIVEADAP